MRCFAETVFVVREGIAAKVPAKQEVEEEAAHGTRNTHSLDVTLFTKETKHVKRETDVVTSRSRFGEVGSGGASPSFDGGHSPSHKTQLVGNEKNLQTPRRALFLLWSTAWRLADRGLAATAPRLHRFWPHGIQLQSKRYIRTSLSTSRDSNLLNESGERGSNSGVVKRRTSPLP